MRASFFMIAACFAVVACDDDDSNSENAVDSAIQSQVDATVETPTVDAAVQPDAAIELDAAVDVTAPWENLCRSNVFGFTAEFEQAYRTKWGVNYTAGAQNREPYDLLYVTWNSENPQPGVYDLSGHDFSNCEFCVYSLDRYYPSSGNYSTFYFADEGFVEVDSVGDAGETFSGTFHGVMMRQATLNEDRTSTPTSGGKSWCANEHTFSAKLLQPAAEVGEIASDFTLQNCGSEQRISMASLAQQTKALWLIAVAGWCSACAAYIPQVEEFTSQVSSDKITQIYVLGENSNEGRPTLNYCRQFAAQHNVDPNKVFIDHDGTNSFAELFSALDLTTDSNGMFGLPWNAVLESDMNYRYSDGATNENLSDIIESYLD